MSQDTGLFSVRRQTLGGISHNASAIPLPMSAMKKQTSSSNLQAPFTSNAARSVSGSRMSLAPGRPNQPIFQRASSGGNFSEMGFSTAQRTSSSNMLGSAGGRKSYAPVSATPASALQLQQSAQRRSSVYSGRQSNSLGPASGHQSFFNPAPPAAGVQKDPRPLRNPNYQGQMAQELSDYLAQGNFDMEMKYNLSQNWMKSPTQKDFTNLFQWLYRRIDPTYRFIVGKNLDTEVVSILQQLRYPFRSSITKSQITAVGGQNWSTFLGMLHWMMQLAQMMDQYAQGAFDEACIDAGFDVAGDRIIFNFLTDAYQEWLTMGDDEDDDKADELLKPHVAAMAAKFDQANEKYLDQLRILEAERKALQNQIDELGKAAPRLAKLGEEVKVLEEDRGKFDEYNANLEAKLDRSEKRTKLFEEEILKIEEELQEAEKEKVELQGAVDRQGMTIQDIDRMVNERERLQRGIEAAVERLEESKHKTSEKEAEASQRLENLERTIQEYNSLGYKVGLIPSTAQNAKEQDYELSLLVNKGPDFRSSRGLKAESLDADRLLLDSNSGYQPQHLLNLDIKGITKNNILALRREISERRNAAAESDMNNKDMLDKIKEAIEDKQQDVETLGHRVRAAEEDYEKTREITNATKMTSDAQIEKTEKELAKMRTTMTESLQLLEQRELNANIEYEQLTIRAAALRDEMHTEIERMLDDIIKFKNHIQDNLEGYELFLEEEVEKAVEERQVAELKMQEDGV